MMLEIAVGDAYGCQFENSDLEKAWLERNNNLTYHHPRNFKKRPDDYQPSLIAPGRYTDDTQMAIAVVLAMLDEEEPWQRETLAEYFLQVFKRDQRRGYTTYFLNVLLNSSSGPEMLTRINGKSTKSGAAMRAGPIGLYPNINEVVQRAKRQAAVTHDSWLGKNSAVGAALMTHYFYYHLGPREDLSMWLRDTYFADMIHSDEPFEVDGEFVQCWKPEHNRRVRVHAWDCLEAAIYAIESHDNMADILKQCVEYMGDVDTVAAIAMGPASLATDIEQNLPEELVENLENKKYGRDYLRFLDKKLFEKFPRPEPKEKIHEESLVTTEDCPLAEAERSGGCEEVLGRIQHSYGNEEEWRESEVSEGDQSGDLQDRHDLREVEDTESEPEECDTLEWFEETAFEQYRKRSREEESGEAKELSGSCPDVRHGEEGDCGEERGGEDGEAGGGEDLHVERSLPESPERLPDE